MSCVPDVTRRYSALFLPSVFSCFTGSKKAGNYISQTPLLAGFLLGPAKEIRRQEEEGSYCTSSSGRALWAPEVFTVVSTESEGEGS